MHTYWTEESKTLYLEMTSFCIENSKESTKELLELINEFCELQDINMQNAIIFLLTMTIPKMKLREQFHLQ